MIFPQIDQSESPDSYHLVLESVLNAAIESDATPEALDSGALAVAMWKIDRTVGRIAAHVIAEEGPSGDFLGASCVRIIYQPGLQAGRTAQYWGRFGSCAMSDATSDYWRHYPHRYGSDPDSARHLYVALAPSNLAAFLKEFGMPKLDIALVDQLVSSADGFRSLDIPENAAFDSDSPEWGNLRYPPFDQEHFLPTLTLRPLTEHFFQTMLYSKGDLADRSMRAAIQMNRPQWINRMLDGGYPSAKAVEMAANAIESIRLLISRGVDVLSPCKGRSTALHLTDKAEICHLLIEQGADVHTLDADGKTPLHYQLEKAPDWNLFPEAQKRQLEAAKALLDAGADPFYLPAEAKADYLSPFQHAVRFGDVAHVELIVQRFAVDFAQRTLGNRTLAQLCGKNSDMKQLLNAAKTQARVESAIEENASMATTPLRAAKHLGMAAI